MKWLLLCFLASVNFIDNSPFVIEADKAVSANGKLILSGHVKITSGLLTAIAEEATSAHDKTGPITLTTDVLLSVENYGQIACDKAVLDPNTHRALFTGQGHPVVYRDAKNELFIDAKTMSLVFTEQKIENFEAHEDVIANWRYGVRCASLTASYFPDSHLMTFETAHITVKDKSDLHATKAAFNTKTHTITLERVKGILQAKETLHVESDTLIYKDPQIHLKGQIQLAMDLKAGPAVLTGVDDCLIDEVHHTVVLLPESKGRILLTTPYGTVTASSIDVAYEREDKEYKIRSLLLKGDVQLANTFSFKDPEMPVNRYALADVVEVDCYERIMTLKATNNKRVLFFDEGKKVQVSADAIAVCYKDGQEEISGKGAVRMLFNESELSRMTEHFKS